jgi:hypothetical protein
LNVARIKHQIAKYTRNIKDRLNLAYQTLSRVEG